MDLSIIIPALNEAQKIAADITAGGAFLRTAGFKGEVIVVDDGSVDKTAETASKALLGAGVEGRVLSLPGRRGKGFAIRKGVAASTGEHVMFADSGVCIPFSSALDGLALIQAGKCDIAHGSRKMPGTTIHHKQSLHRRVGSYFLMWWLHRLAGIRGLYSDTQCGFKVYRGEVARELFAACFIDGFMFDIEIILRARKKGYVIAEFPVEWSCDPDTRLRPVEAARQSLKEVWEIRRKLG